MKPKPSSYVMSFLRALDARNLQYAVVRDLNNVLPDRYMGEADVDIIINPRDWQQAKDVLLSMKWFEVLHPFDNLRDFTFLYGMRRFKFFIRGNAKLDICFQLACRSTNAGEWVPLDQTIQESVWSNRKWDESRCCYVLSPLDECVHLLARAFFDKQKVTQEYLTRIEHLFNKIDAELLEDRLKLVFFKAAGTVMACLRNRELDQLVDRVRSYDNY